LGIFKCAARGRAAPSAINQPFNLPDAAEVVD